MDKMLSEKRLVKRLGDYWEHIRGDNAIPLASKFNQHAVPDIWDFCFMMEVDNRSSSQLQYRYDYVGKMIIEAFGRDLTGNQVSAQLQSVPGAGIIKKIDECVANRLFLLEDGKFINDKSKVIKYRSCMAPLATGDKVSHVVVGLSWKAF